MCKGREASQQPQITPGKVEVPRAYELKGKHHNQEEAKEKV